MENLKCKTYNKYRFASNFLSSVLVSQPPTFNFSNHMMRNGIKGHYSRYKNNLYDVIWVGIVIQLTNLAHYCDGFNDENSARSSHRRCSIKKVVHKSFTKLIEKHLYQRLLFNKVTGLRPAINVNVNFVKFLRTPFLQNNSRRLLL